MLNESDLAELRAHGVVVFGEKVIFDAQPPIDADTLAWVQQRCSGPIPASVVDLWSTTSGGYVDYDVNVFMGGADRSFSWVELFFRGADTYRDLEGWIDHELELAEEAANERGVSWSGQLDWLPIGGFEYLDRAYVRVAQDDTHGAVLLWMQGLPAAWEGYLHEDTGALFAPDLVQAFARFQLDEHPVTGVGQYRRGLEFLRYVEERVSTHGMSIDLAARVVDFYAEAVGPMT